MKLRPTIFLSGVSSEFGSFRDAAEIEVQKKDCFPINQPSFGTDYRELEAILRAKLSEADAVIHLAGFRFGFEPNNQPAGKPRRSYTQMEYDIAGELGKPVYVFLSAEARVRDADAQPEDAEAMALQLTHRQTLQSLNNIRYTFRNKNELCNLVAGIPLLATADFRVDISRIDRYAPAELIGRDDELKLLDDAWLKVRRAESKRPQIITFVALGGEGKTSLAAKWLAELAYQNWPGCDSAFAWSFYSQGTRDQVAASSDLFLKEAITFFGNEDDRQFAAGSAEAYEKGQRLARIVGKRRSLLILDGVEPLQYSPTSPTRSELKDAGLVAVLKGLAADSDGLCIVTTRYSIPNIKAYWQTTAPEVELLRLSRGGGVHLLKTLGVHGTTNEFESLVEDVKGHALTLNLLGSYLRDAHGGDIRRQDLVNLDEADVEEQGGHAFRVMQAYEQAFEKEGDKGKRALAILRLLGLFDRPVSADCLATLLEKPTIPGLTDALIGLSEPQRNLSITRLEDAKLVTVNREASGVLGSFDAHPLLREYFAQQLRAKQAEAWRMAHRLLYERLCATTPDKEKPSLEDLQPLYQAVAHGCQAGLQQEACEEVYLARILRRKQFYSLRTLGAFASDIGALASFFETPWSRVSPALSEPFQAWVCNEAATRLRTLGRLTEALEPMRDSVKMWVKQENWQQAALSASNLSELELTLGEVAEAVKDAEQSVTYADRSQNEFQRMGKRTTHADSLHQAGRRDESMRCFEEAEQIQVKCQPEYPLLYSLQGFRYCELLLGTSERTAWQRTLECRDWSPLAGSLLKSESNTRINEQTERGQSRDKSSHSIALQEILQRAAQTLQWVVGNFGLLDEALNYLTLGRTALYEAVLASTGWPLEIQVSKLESTLERAVDSLRRGGRQDHLPRALLTRAWLRFFTAAPIGPESAQQDLEEAWEIAERGPMRLHMSDIHLYRARLFFRESNYPWESPQADLEAAEKLINGCGYHRRDEELGDAKRVILGQSV